LKGAVSAEDSNEFVCSVNQLGKLCWAEPCHRLCVQSLCHEFAASRLAVRAKPAGETC
jgi:hypothetical protein